MSTPFAVRIQGVDELRKAFSELSSDAQQRSALRAALRVAASVVVKEAKARVPAQTGDLQKSIAAKVTVNRKSAEAKIGFGKQEFYGMFVELGTSRTAARPFLRPALDAKQREAIEKFASAFRQIVERMRARLHKVRG